MRRGIIFVSEKIKLTFLFRDAAIDEGAAAMSWTLLQLDSCCITFVDVYVHDF